MSTILAAGLLVLTWAATFVAAPLSVSPAFAQSGPSTGSQGGPVIERILVEGAQRIEPDTIRTYLRVTEGDPFDRGRIDDSLKALFLTGLFADVSLRREGNDLVVVVVENPIINRVAFEGNKRIQNDALAPEVQMRPRTVYTRAKVQEDVKRILDVYRRSGRYAVSVDPKIIELPQNRVDLVFEIDEGPATYVRRVTFVGNSAFSDSSLRDVIATKEERWYRLLSSSDTFDPDRLTFDRELLRRFYLANGYADFEVRSAVAELTPDRESFFITVTVDEGDRYRIGSVGIETTLEDLTPEMLTPTLEMEEGDWYDADRVEETVQNITDMVGSLGYAFVDVRPRVERDREANTISLTFDVREGPRVFVDRIEIEGNVRTLDEVIRREFQLVEGDAFNSAKLRRSRQRVRDLGFFQSVEVNNEPVVDKPDRTVIRVEVEEQSTGELSFGVGWSSSVGAMVEVGVRERNLLGRGQDLSARVSWAQRRSQVELSFTEPYFMDRPVSAGFDLFATEEDLEDQSSHQVRQQGGALRFGYKYSNRWRHDYKYTLQRQDIFDVEDDASLFIKEQEGVEVLSMIGHSLTYDDRDSRIVPTEGFRFEIGNDVAGLGGDARFLRTDVDGSYHYPLGDELNWDPTWVLGVRGHAGYIVGLSKDVSIRHRYFLGGSNLRGFEQSGASARDRATGDALGGDWMVDGGLELRVPLGLPDELGLGAKIFTDWGLSGEPDGVPDEDLNQDTALRGSVGMGFLWTSPVGPVNVDLAVPVVKQPYDKEEFFRLSFGSRF
ncbi:outer membrane protein assembly factor BamA [Roseospira marina]|uniref:outer membrane protein assembly factor BamA n=1 Tax=Roseospira marina TaxID=140057 RepID=UPI001833B482|nr:outer membrane protein assembly factor BamA [Roseospira marina]MBB4315528.1 outer membrane protein insertion porin family [Roseospira marina]MBB5088535.1 outer membrane protein insertion porin family [Roseospira marina]